MEVKVSTNLISEVTTHIFFLVSSLETIKQFRSRQQSRITLWWPPLTTKSSLQLNYRTTVIKPEVQLNVSLIIEDIQKRLVGRAETQNWLGPHPCMAVKNEDGYLSCGGSSKEQGVPALYQDLKLRVPVPRRKVPTYSGCEN